MADNPAIIRKGDGGFLYATTDLATIDFRISEWKADAIWYVVGVPQQLHFRQIFSAARRWGKSADFQHIAFGSILGEDRKLMKTRSGDNVQLADVLNEAVERAAVALAGKNPDPPAEEAASIAKIIGIGAVKFSELSQNRLTDYVFWGPVRLPCTATPRLISRTVYRQDSLDSSANWTCHSILPPRGSYSEEDAEVHLARLLLRFGEVVPTVLDDFRPNLLTNYLLELARAYHSFYEACPVLKSEASVRDSRLALCDLTARSSWVGLLGIRVPERM